MAGARRARAAAAPRTAPRAEGRCAPRRSSGALAQQREQPLQRLPAMADAVLFVVLELGCSGASAFHDEQRVVAETVRTARRPRDRSEPASLGDERLGVRGMP